MNDTVIYFGGEIKALDDNGKVGGQLVRFSTNKDRDLTNEYFTAKTYLGKDDGDGVDVLFHHGIPVKKGLEGFAEHIFSNPVKTSRSDVGVWAETVLDLADEYEQKVFELVKAGKLGWSSGSTSRVVRKSADGEITRWPIIEASLTHSPCEPRNSAVAIKSADDFSALFTPKESPISSKGLFNQNLAEQQNNFWRLESAMCETAKDIANAAASSGVTGVSVDVSALVSEAVMEFAGRLTPMITSQINEWLDSTNRENFYLKSTFLDAIISSESPVKQRFEDRLDTVLAAVERVANDAKEIHEMRQSQKAGRKISQSRMTKLKEMATQLSALIAEVEGEGESATPSEKSVDQSVINSLVANFEHTKLTRTLASR
jgi:hypothetical protein